MSERRTLTQKDINLTMLRWYFSCEISLNYERMQSMAFCYALSPVLKKLYTEKERFSEALKRHLEMFNINATAGGLVLGSVLAMEEEKANNDDAITGEAINAFKVGLMGPVSALGDSFSAGTITTLFILAACQIASTGSILGWIVLLIGSMYTMGELVVFTNLTYKKGKEAISSILSSSWMNDIIEGANVLGMAMMGAMTAGMVSLPIGITATFGEGVVAVQDKLDSIMPGLLPLCVLIVYYLLISKKKVNIITLVIATIIIAVLGCLIGLFPVL